MAANGSNISRYDYNTDARGVRTALQEQIESDPVKTLMFSYDPANQLTGEAATGGKAGEAYASSYQYDSAGNRTRFEKTSATTSTVTNFGVTSSTMKLSSTSFFVAASMVVFFPLNPVSSQIAGESRVTPLRVGRAAPHFASLDASYRRRTLADLKGRRQLLLTFFPRCFTGNCASQLTSLRDSYPALQKAGVEVWAVSTDPADGPQGQRAFAKHLKLPFTLLPDPSRKLSLAFGAVQSKKQMATRMSVLIGKDGVVRWIDKQINPRTHGADVLVRIRAEAKATPPAK